MFLSANTLLLYSFDFVLFGKFVEQCTKLKKKALPQQPLIDAISETTIMQSLPTNHEAMLILLKRIK